MKVSKENLKELTKDELIEIVYKLADNPFCENYIYNVVNKHFEDIHKAKLSKYEQATFEAEKDIKEFEQFIMDKYATSDLKMACNMMNIEEKIRYTKLITTKGECLDKECEELDRRSNEIRNK